MNLRLRSFTLEDAEVCGQICYEAFKQIDEAHGFPPAFESPEVAAGLLASRASMGFYGVVAEVDGRIAGSNFMDERGAIGGIGPISVDLDYQNAAIGRQLMQDVIDRGASQGLAGVRLTQAAYHNRSLSLYAKLGFVVREPLAVMKGQSPAAVPPGYYVRPAVADDIAACAAVCVKVHGHERAAELKSAVERGAAKVVERSGRITGYVTMFGGGHAVAETNEDMKALISAWGDFAGNGFLVPTRNAELFDWCLNSGLRVVEPMTLMSIGLYNEPAGAFVPSYLY